MNTPFGSEVQVCGEYEFSLEGTSLHWTRLLIKKYKFAVNTTFVWTVQIWDEYDFCLKGPSLQSTRLLIKKYKFAMNTIFLWKVLVCSEYDFSLKGTSLQWIRILIQKYKFAVNTTFVWKVKVCSTHCNIWVRLSRLHTGSEFLFFNDVCFQWPVFYAADGFNHHPIVREAPLLNAVTNPVAEVDDKPCAEDKD